jgi:hypothetical protein
LRRQNNQLQKVLTEQLKASSDRESRLIDALDRVIASKFDPPVTLPHTSYSQPARTAIPMEHMMDVLSVEDDGDFIAAVSQAVTQ